MDVDDGLVLFLGAGVSAPMPTGGPMFNTIRAAALELAGVKIHGLGKRKARKARLLENTIPEVFLKHLTHAGYMMSPALIDAVSTMRGAAPNAVHELAAELLANGGAVWTTNWDTWIEDAYTELTGDVIVAAGPHLGSLRPGAPKLVKLHGSVHHPDSLRFNNSDVLRSIEPTWQHLFVQHTTGHSLAVAGYAGADIDLYPMLQAGIDASNATYWFEGVINSPATLESADYESWRFGLADRVDPLSLNDDGPHLVWCGDGPAVTNPSDGLLVAAGRPPARQPLPPWETVRAHVTQCLDGVDDSAVKTWARWRLAAGLNERLGQRARAVVRHAGVIALGPTPAKARSVRAIGNIVLLRPGTARTLASELFQRVARPGEHRDFVALHRGNLTIVDDTVVTDLLANPTGRSDKLLDTAASIRWTGDLRTAEALAQAALDEVLAQDLDSRDRDWPERVSRATYELAVACTWQGRLFAAEQWCRTGYLRVSGAKWLAWEHTLRAGITLARGNAGAADKYLEDAIEILITEGFDNFTIALIVSRATCARANGNLEQAAAYLRRARRGRWRTLGTSAALLTEQAEIVHAQGSTATAIEILTKVTESPLPLHRGTAHLRLAELGNPNPHAHLAAGAYALAGSDWGRLRVDALVGNWDRATIERNASGLGPWEIFEPGAITII